MTTMTCTYELTYIVDALDDDTQMQLLEEGINIGTSGRLHSAFLAVIEATPLAAARKGYSILRSHGVRVTRAHLDLVTQAQIAERAGYSKPAVRDWVRATGGGVADQFPREHDWIGSSPVWAWADVNEWLRRNSKRGFDDYMTLDCAGVEAFNQWLRTAPRQPGREATSEAFSTSRNHNFSSITEAYHAGISHQ